MGASRDDGFLAMLEHGRRRSEHEFGADRFILEIIQMATVDQLERNSSFWAFPR
jgi:hypothetical protein